MWKIVLICFISWSFIQCAAQDPCKNFQVIDDSTRTTNYTLGDSETEQCDRTLQEDWYKIVGGGNIPTECQRTLNCGSTMPIWLKGALPTVNGSQNTVTACKSGFVTCCDESYTTVVRNCGAFNVFRLVPLRLCPGRYCVVGPPTPCIDGWSSESGFEPCKQLTITFVVTPTVQPYIPTYESGSPRRNLTFECKANIISTYQRYLFDVKWYVDHSEVATKKHITYDFLRQDGSLYREDWDPGNNKTVGIWVMCAMRARQSLTSVPTKYTSSAEFFAGAVVAKTAFSIQSGEKVTISVKSTVPIACAFYGNRTDCKFPIELFSFQDQIKNQPKYCNQSITKSIVGSHCGILFDGSLNTYNTWHNLYVTTPVDLTTRASYTASVKLTAINGFDSLWAEYQLPEIKIHVQAVRRPEGNCHSVNDPNFKTFDGHVFSIHDAGEFVLFNHTSKPLSVHTIHRWDTAENWEANCAVAIRAASDIFIIYGCTEPTRWLSRRLNCDREMQNLEVYERAQGQEYEVVMPTGTRIQVFLKTTFLNIYIYASASDFGLTQGLCGTYNGNIYDELTDRKGLIVNQDTFVRTWSVSQKESLFIAKSRTEILKEPYYYCSCIKDQFPVNGLTPKADCTWEESLPICQPLNWNVDNCKIRNKREASDEIEIDVLPEKVMFQKAPKEVFEWKNGWTESKARERCLSVLQSSNIYKICNTLHGINNDLTVKSCMDDIQVTGSVKFLEAVIDVMKSQCVNEVRFNDSLWNLDSSSGEIISEVVLEKDCPNDCSSNGDCVQGFCECSPYYTGDDCSANINGAPIIFNVTDDYLCDLQKRQCASFSVFGIGFYDSQNLVCKIARGRLTEAGVIDENVTRIVSGRLFSFSEVNCPLSAINERKRRSLLQLESTDAFLISLSMNGRDFSSAIPVVIYDSSCTRCELASNMFVCHMRDDVCLYNGACYPRLSSFCMTIAVKQGNTEIAAKHDFWIIGAVLGAVFLLILIMLAVAKFRNTKKRNWYPKHIQEIGTRNNQNFASTVEIQNHRIN